MAVLLEGLDEPPLTYVGLAWEKQRPLSNTRKVQQSISVVILSVVASVEVIVFIIVVEPIEFVQLVFNLIVVLVVIINDLKVEIVALLRLEF